MYVLLYRGLFGSQRNLVRGFHCFRFDKLTLGLDNHFLGV